MNPLPSPLQKIIIEYCYYPKLYLEELKEKTDSIYNSIYYSIIDFGYTYDRVIRHSEDKWIIRSHIIMVDTRYNLMVKNRDRDYILNMGSVDFLQRGYCSY